MNMLTAIFIAAAEGPHRDDQGQVITHHWLFPERSELIYGTVSSVIIFYLLYRFAGPAIKKGFTDRTARIQAELDASAEARAQASTEAAEIRTARGDIDAERQRVFADADAQAEALLVDGRARLEQEVIDLEARAQADLLTMSGRAGDELRAEIARLSSTATEQLLGQGLDAATHQDLIESFIQEVGARS
jgi:F-type H+-transporting ATPase subunit b